MGDFQINLYDETTPETVQNFLQYVNSGAYANNVVHRSVDGFVVQAGGFTYNGSIPLDNVATDSPVTNEPVLSNVRGTISMAKLDSDENSATSIPLHDYTATDLNNNVEITDDHLVIITDIVLIDANTVTNPALTPIPNTLINPTPTPNPSEPNSGGSGGGSLGYLLLIGLIITALRVQPKH